MNKEQAWAKWLEAQKSWASCKLHGDNTWTPEALFFVRDGQPLKAVEYLNA